MARSISEIYQEIIAEKNSQTNLQALAPQSDSLEQFQSDLNSTSKVATWRLFAYLIAIAIFTHEKFWDLFKVELQDLIAAAPVGTTRWYQEQVLSYQYADPLVYINSKYVYANIDESKQIVKLCSVSERPDSTLVVKAAKLDSNQQPIPLLAVEQTALIAYLQKIKFAGTRLAVISDDADVLKIQGIIYYDPLFPIANLQIQVEQAIEGYIKNLPFNGVFKINNLIDAIQAVQGVTDFQYSSIEATYGNIPYAAVNRIYTANAGYLKIDVNAPLSSTLTYTPSID